MAATGTARWDGSIYDAAGTMTAGAAETVSFSKVSRFAGGDGSNPAELVVNPVVSKV